MLEKNSYGMLGGKNNFMILSIILRNSPSDCEFQPIHEIRSRRKIELLCMAILALVVYEINSKKRRQKSYLLLSPNMYGIVSVNDGVILVKKQIIEHL